MQNESIIVCCRSRRSGWIYTIYAMLCDSKIEMREFRKESNQERIEEAVTSSTLGNKSILVINAKLCKKIVQISMKSP